MDTTGPGPLSVLERAIRRDRLVFGLGLTALTLLAWAYLTRTAGDMAAMSADAQMHAAMGMLDTRMWGASDWAALFAMWAVMMVGMMLPSAAPVILLVLGVYRRRGHTGARLAAGMFVAGYLLVWTAFSAAAAAIQVVLHRAALLNDAMASASAGLTGVVLLLAGLYQWLPVKAACLTHCQSPLGFLSQHWREGAAGGLGMGLRHGAFCVGCCWALMALLFVAGVMNLLWVAAIAAFVMVEKMVGGQLRLARAAGTVLAAAGIYSLLR